MAIFGMPWKSVSVSLTWMTFAACHTATPSREVVADRGPVLDEHAMGQGLGLHLEAPRSASSSPRTTRVPEKTIRSPSQCVALGPPFVVAASIILAASFLIPFAWPAGPARFVQSVLGGFGLGVSSPGQNLGQALGPILAGVIVAVSGGAYGPVWPIGFVLVLLAAFVIIPIKRVR